MQALLTRNKKIELHKSIYWMHLILDCFLYKFWSTLIFLNWNLEFKKMILVISKRHSTILQGWHAIKQRPVTQPQY